MTSNDNGEIKDYTSKDNFSRTVPSSASQEIRDRFTFTRVFNKVGAKEWIRNPMSMAFMIWILVVTVSGAILFLVVTGMLNHALPKKTQRDAWFEVNYQILNALFTLMCLYQHPQRLRHLARVIRWKVEDIVKLRRIYSKGGTYKPHEWLHMLVVVFLFNLNCFAQYAFCGLNVGYKRSERPAIGVGITISVSIGSSVFAGLYTIYGPLGKKYDYNSEEEEPEHDEESVSGKSDSAFWLFC